MKYNIYVVERTDKVGYDEYESMVVVACDEMTAREIHPSGYDTYTNKGWVDDDQVFNRYHAWVDVSKIRDDLKVKKIGETDIILKNKVVLSNYIAG